MHNAIWNYINTNFDPSVTYFALMSTGDKSILNFAKGLSNELNSRFDRAWNVFVPYTTVKSNADTVLYGYAFRDHWFWYNGYKMNDGYYVSFIIWKDYNCQTYIVYDPTKNGASSYTGTEPTVITKAIDFVKNGWRYDDPWKAAQSLVDYLQKTSFAGRNTAFTVVFGQSTSIVSYAYVCALNYSLKEGVGINGLTTGGNNNGWAQVFVFQMR